MYVECLDRLEGIPRGATALFLKIHHAVMDGKSALRVKSSFHSLDPEPGSPLLADSIPQEAPADSNFRPPSLLVKYGRAWIHSIERPVELIGTLAKVFLYTRIDDVKKRLLAISADSSRCKHKSKKGSSRAALELVDEIHPAIILSLGKWLINSGFIDALPQTVNTVVTNVPGISGDAYIEGSKLVDYLGFGPLAPNMGLFHTVSSTADHVNISFLSTAEFIGDGLAYRTSIAQSWQEISNL